MMISKLNINLLVAGMSRFYAKGEDVPNSLL